MSERHLSLSSEILDKVPVEFKLKCFIFERAYLKSLMVLMVKNLPAMQKTWVGSLGQKAPLEKGMAIHSSNLAWKISQTEEPGGL